MIALKMRMEAVANDFESCCFIVKHLIKRVFFAD
jgi:hypothetical protein